MQKTTFRHFNHHSQPSAAHQSAGRFARWGLAAMLGLGVAGCSTSGNQQPTTTATGEPRVTQAELEAFCPRISLREGTAFFSTYEKGGQGDNTRVMYQASISDVTRDCRSSGGTVTINVAAAGRVVPGPKFRGGTVSLPIRVAVLQGDKVLSSNLHKQAVAMPNMDSAAQFLLSGATVSVPESAVRQVEILIGFDEGPTKG